MWLCKGFAVASMSRRDPLHWVKSTRRSCHRARIYKRHLPINVVLSTYSEHILLSQGQCWSRVEVKDHRVNQSSRLLTITFRPAHLPNCCFPLKLHLGCNYLRSQSALVNATCLGLALHWSVSTVVAPLSLFTGISWDGVETALVIWTQSEFAEAWQWTEMGEAEDGGSLQATSQSHSRQVKMLLCKLKLQQVGGVCFNVLSPTQLCLCIYMKNAHFFFLHILNVKPECYLNSD